MARKVITAPAAARALQNARRWLLQPGSGSIGAAKWSALRNVRRILRDHPYLRVPHEEQARYRRITVSSYRVVYRVDSDTGDESQAGKVTILQVFGPGQDDQD